MSKKIALFLIMVMLVNMALWADTPISDEDSTTLTIVAVSIVAVLVVSIFLIEVAEANPPDDGIRLASMQTVNPESKTGFGAVLNILQHIEVGQTKDNKLYTGFRFKF
jgi:hypothetical protein